MTKLNWLDWTALVLVTVGGLNWGLEALNWNLVDALFGAESMLSTAVYALVGLSALYMIYLSKRLMSDSSM